MTNVNSSHRLEEENGTGQRTEHVASSCQKPITQAEVLEAELLMCSSKTKSLKMYQERWTTSVHWPGKSAVLPLMHSLRSSRTPLHSILRPSTISCHRSLTILSSASTGKRYAKRLYTAAASTGSRDCSGGGIILIRREPEDQLYTI
jgi:hypothetical protein